MKPVAKKQTNPEKTQEPEMNRLCNALNFNREKWFGSVWVCMSHMSETPSTKHLLLNVNSTMSQLQPSFSVSF